MKITEMKSSTTRPLDSITSTTISATRSSMWSRVVLLELGRSAHRSYRHGHSSLLLLSGAQG